MSDHDKDRASTPRPQPGGRGGSERDAMAMVDRLLTGPGSVLDSDDEDHVGWTIHLQAEVPDKATAIAVARALCLLAVSELPHITVGQTEVSPADAWSHCTRVFCDRRIPALAPPGPGRGSRQLQAVNRCGLPQGHRGLCAPSPGRRREA